MKKIYMLAICITPFLNYHYKPFTYVRTKVKIDKILILPPVSNISVINKGSRFQTDSALSKMAFEQTTYLLQKNFHDSIKTSYFLPDSAVQSALARFLMKFNSEINIELQANLFRIPDSIVNLLRPSNVNLFFVPLILVLSEQEKTWLIPNRHLKLLTF